jgi:uncharacterized protein YndB with AHSA1/START domain
MKGDMTFTRSGERELVVTRTFDAPVNIVFKAWTQADIFQRWWAPASTGLKILSCELDVRTGGGYRLEISHPQASQPLVFFGRYTDVVPNARMVWTNEEEGGGNVTTLTFEEKAGKTFVTLHELYPSKEACDAAEGMDEAWHEQFGQLDAVLPTLK